MITAIIVDDEKQARDGLKVLLKHDPEVEVIACCKNGIEAIEEVTRRQPHLLFLDIQMPEINGFEVLSSLPHGTLPAVIFATAYDKYALRAFEVHAIDYLLKPFTDKRFFEALNRAKQQVGDSQTQTLNQRLLHLLNDYRTSKHDVTPQLIEEASRVTAAPDRLVLKASGEIHFVPFGRIESLQSDDYYVNILTDGRQYLVRESLKALLQRLPAGRFERIHRSTIVNTTKIISVTPYANGDFSVTLRTGERVRGSRKYRKTFFERLGV